MELNQNDEFGEDEESESEDLGEDSDSDDW